MAALTLALMVVLDVLAALRVAPLREQAAAVAVATPLLQAVVLVVAAMAGLIRRLLLLVRRILVAVAAVAHQAVVAPGRVALAGRAW